MKKYLRQINEILGQIYQEKSLQRCLRETIKPDPERIAILHYVVMNIDCLSKEEIREYAYCYGQTVKAGELVARQIFLCLLHLAKMEK